MTMKPEAVTMPHYSLHENTMDRKPLGEDDDEGPSDGGGAYHHGSMSPPSFPMMTEVRFAHLYGILLTVSLEVRFALMYRLVLSVRPCRLRRPWGSLRIRVCRHFPARGQRPSSSTIDIAALP